MGCMSQSPLAYDHNNMYAALIIPTIPAPKLAFVTNPWLEFEARAVPVAVGPAAGAPEETTVKEGMVGVANVAVGILGVPEGIPRVGTAGGGSDKLVSMGVKVGVTGGGATGGGGPV